MSVRVSRLANGFTVATDSMENVETVSLGVWVGVGARHEAEEVNGVSHLLEHMAFKGTGRRSAAEIVDEVESVGGHINAYTSRENTAYYLRVLAGDVPLAVDILSDILRDSTYDPAEIERERAVILQEIGQCADTPDDVIFDHFQEAAYPGQALGRPVLGTEAHVRALDRDALLAHMAAHYRAPRMVLAAAGKVDHERLLALAAEAFGDFPGGEPAPAEPARYAGGHRTERRRLEQLHVVLGHEGLRYDDPDYYAAQALAVILGGGMSSRLFQEIREKRGLVYSIFAFHAPYQDGGLFGVYAGTGENDVRELMPVLSGELGRIGRTVTGHEIDRVRMQLKAGLLMAMESTRARAERLGQHILTYGRPLTAEELVARVEAVDATAIARVAERLFGGKPTLTALGPAGGLKSLPAAEAAAATG